MKRSIIYALFRNAIVLPQNYISKFIFDEPRMAVLGGVIINDPHEVETSYGLRKTSFTVKARYI